MDYIQRNWKGPRRRNINRAVQPKWRKDLKIKGLGPDAHFQNSPVQEYLSAGRHLARVRSTFHTQDCV